MKTKEVLNRFSITAKKSLGQNFLTDNRILQKIVDAAHLSGDDGVLEIGPGIGALTECLAKTAGTVVAVEIDQRLLPVLGSTLKAHQNVHIVHGDILKLDLEALWRDHFQPGQEVSVAANLPYYITTPIIMRLLESRIRLENIVVMVQKEVADRLAARPGGKQYGSLSIAVQYYCEPETVCIVPRSAFIPQPGVDSAVIRLRVRDEPPVRPKDELHFFGVIQSSFAQRRKTILNNLLQSPLCTGVGRPQLEALLLQAGIESSRRGETLSIEEYARLSDTLLLAAAK
jgi:16S rRNA (adenine1518-N6/adenine1519-N6)-dimethyltransferase